MVEEPNRKQCTAEKDVELIKEFGRTITISLEFHNSWGKNLRVLYGS